MGEGIGGRDEGEVSGCALWVNEGWSGEILRRVEEGKESGDLCQVQRCVCMIFTTCHESLRCGLTFYVKGT